MSYNKIIGRMEDIAFLRASKVNDFFQHVKNLRVVMGMIGKDSITLNTSEPLGPNHSTHGVDRKYTLTITNNNITLMDGNMKTQIVDETYLGNCKWFQVYIYVVEIELELTKIHNHILDSINVSDSIKNK